MAVRYDALLARTLADELHARHAGEPVAALGMQPEAWTSAIVFSGGSVLWSFLHPLAGQIVAGGASPIDSVLADRSAWRKTLKAGSVQVDGWSWFPFRSLRVAAVRAVPDERLILLDLAGGDGTSRFRIALDLPRNRRNVLLLDTAMGRIHAVLRPRPGRLERGRAYRMPVGQRAGADRPLGSAEWQERFAGSEPESRRELLLRQVAYSSPLNAGYILRDQDLKLGHARYLEILEGEGFWLLTRDWGRQPYVHRLGDEDAVSVRMISEGMARSATDEGVEAPAAEPGPVSAAGQRIAEALRARQKRLLRRITGLESELEEGDPPERLREDGHLLLARLKDVRRGETSVDLKDFEGGRRTIRLDPALTPADNADRYYRAASRRERALGRLPGLIAEAREEAGRIDEGLRRLTETGRADAELQELAGLETALPAGTRKATGRRLPYRRYVSTGGLEVRVGRSSKENDDLTFRHSSPNDIWLHARLVPGAHVILRWGDGEQNPPERDLTEAAILAAVHSDARSSGVVAVDWTRRKHVRKPRKSAPGIVTAERLKTVFVEPAPDAPDRMSRDS